MRIQPSPLKRTRLESISSSVDHQPSSSPHGARGSPGLPWSYAAHRARGELGKRRDPEPSRIGAEVCSPSTVSFCRMQLLEARFVPFRRKALDGSHPKLAMRGILGPVQTGLLHAKSAYSAKEKTFGVGFKLRRPPAKQQCPRSQRHSRPP